MKSRLSLHTAVRKDKPSAITRKNDMLFIKKAGVIQAGYRADLLPHDRVTVPGFTGSW